MELKKPEQLSDSGIERVLLASIIKGGKDSLIDVETTVDSQDFYIPLNKVIFTALKHLSEDEKCEGFDIETVKLQITSLGFGNLLEDQKNLEYFELLEETNLQKDNIEKFAFQIKKYATIRELRKQYLGALDYLNGVTGNETLAEVIGKSEGYITDYINGIDTGSNLEKLGENIDEVIEEKINSPEVEYMGIPTGFPLFDSAIGGGVRPASIALMAARMKVGKSFLAMNQLIRVARNGIPTLLLDTELNNRIQLNRMTSIISGVPLDLYERGAFKYSQDYIKYVRESGKEIKSLPVHYHSIGNIDFNDSLTLIKRWLIKHVGFNKKNQANPCMVILDYLKLLTSDELTKYSPEYIILGLKISSLHNLCVKYDIPIIVYCQTNRDGIDGEQSNIIGGSDRLAMLASSITIFKNKTEEDFAMGAGLESGTRKLKVIETRYGDGMSSENEFINLHASLRPLSKSQATGLITEGFLASEVVRNARQNSNKQFESKGQ